MLFYHFTRAAAVDLILQNGINTGVAPFQVKQKPAVVSLTSVLNSANHGLLTGQYLTEGQSPEFAEVSKFFPSLVTGQPPHRSIQLFDQTEVVLEIDINPQDPKLLSYSDYIDLVLPLNGVKKSEKNHVKARGIVTARYPLGQNHLVMKHLLKEVSDFQYSGAIKDPDWFFYSGSIACSMIVSVKIRDGAGNYVRSI